MWLLVLALAGWAPSVSRGADAESSVPAANWDWHTTGGGGYWSSGVTYAVFSSFSLSAPFGFTANSKFSSYSGFLFPYDPPLRIKNDFDGDLRADIAVYRQADGTWKLWLSGSGYGETTIPGWGGRNFTPVAADYDGDLKTDPAVYNTVTGDWYFWMSTSGHAQTQVAGFGGGDWLAAPADYDGDQITDQGIYEPASGILKVWLSYSGFMGVFANNLGGPRYVPAPEDFDGDRIADPVVYLARRGTWVILLSASGYASVSAFGMGGPALGAPTFAPPAADYDGDGKADPTVYQAKTGNWYVWLSDSSYAQVVLGGLGGSTWTPAPADYDGDARVDLAVYQQNTGNWMFWLSSLGYTPRIDAPGWGGPGFVPVRTY